LQDPRRNPPGRRKPPIVIEGFGKAIMSGHAATKRVLIVDDEAIVLTVLRDFFASFRHGYAYEITTAESASEAFQILRRAQFDLILLDVILPAADGRWLSESNLGFSLLARIRDLGVIAPVLVMTGGGTIAKEAEALDAGAAGFLYKPVGLRELDHAVTGALTSGILARIAFNMSIRRWSGPTPTSNAGEYRIWLSDQPSEGFRRRFRELAQTTQAHSLRLTLEKSAAAFTFVSSGDLKVDLRMIDVLLKEAGQ
jgi:CheY-like chemotaxis protein